MITANERRKLLNKSHYGDRCCARVAAACYRCNLNHYNYLNSPKADGLTRRRFFGKLLLALTMRVKRLNVGVLWTIGLVMLMIDPSVQQQRAGKESGKGRVNMYIVCDPKNLCEFSPCHNGGSCEPISKPDRTPGFRCRCGSGFGGEICLDSKYRSLSSALWRQIW